MQSERSLTMISTFEDVFSAIDGERDYQDTKWGKPHPHEIASFVLFMRGYHNKVVMRASTESGWNGALDELRKVATLGVACMEQHGDSPNGNDGTSRQEIYSGIKDYFDSNPTALDSLSLAAMVILVGCNIDGAEKSVTVLDPVLARDAIRFVASCVAVCVYCMARHGVVRR